MNKRLVHAWFSARNASGSMAPRRFRPRPGAASITPTRYVRNHPGLDELWAEGRMAARMNGVRTEGSAVVGGCGCARPSGRAGAGADRQRPLAGRCAAAKRDSADDGNGRDPGGGPADDLGHARMERRVGQFGPSADDGRRDPPGRGQFPLLSRGVVAGGGAPRRDACELYELDGRAHAGSADHGPDGCPARIHQGVLGLPRPAGQRRQDQARPRNPCRARGGLCGGGEGLWR